MPKVAIHGTRSMSWKGAGDRGSKAPQTRTEMPNATSDATRAAGRAIRRGSAATTAAPTMGAKVTSVRSTSPPSERIGAQEESGPERDRDRVELDPPRPDAPVGAREAHGCRGDPVDRPVDAERVDDRPEDLARDRHEGGDEHAVVDLVD